MMKNSIVINELTAIVVDLCIKIHSRVGPGCFERVYEEILYYELTKLGFKIKRQFLLPIQYDELFIKDAYKIDLLVEDKLILELKSIFPLPPVYFNQIHTHFFFCPCWYVKPLSGLCCLLLFSEHQKKQKK